MTFNVSRLHIIVEVIVKFDVYATFQTFISLRLPFTELCTFRLKLPEKNSNINEIKNF